MSESSRRAVLASGAGAAFASAAAGLTYAASRADASGADMSGAPSEGSAGGSGSGVGGGGSATAAVPFRGTHQAGIVTPAPDRMHFVALDVTTKDPRELRRMLTAWTRAAERMVVGAEAAPGGVVGGGPWGVPQDTGEAMDLPASGLTITIGYGPSLFDGRFGLAGRRPEALRDLPAFLGDDLDPARSDGDLCIQACANDPQVAVHAVRNLIRLGFGVVSVRWSQLGFGRTSSTSTSQVTPRNLFGFKDGTNNLKAEDGPLLDQHVWIGTEAAGATAWTAGGSYLVARRIRMHIEVWDRTPLQEQEEIFGRDKGRGAPLGQKSEFEPIDFSRAGIDGNPAIPLTSHIRLAHSEQLGGVKILRRGYNFIDGTDGQGHLDAGLFFVAFMRNPHTQFVPMQKALASTDILNEYTEHTSSAVFLCPPGLAEVGAGKQGAPDWASQLFS